MQHRDITLEHGAPGARLRSRGGIGGGPQGKTGGVQYHAGMAGLDHPVERTETLLLFQRGHGDGHRVEPALAQHIEQVIEHGHVAVLQVAAIQHHECNRAYRVTRPLGPPVGQVGIRTARVIDHGPCQALWRGRVPIVAQTSVAQAVAGDEGQQRSRVGGPALAQITPDLPGRLARDGARAEQIIVGIILAGYQYQLTVGVFGGPGRELIHAVGPIGPSPGKRHDHHARMIERLVAIQIQSGRLGQIAPVGQAHRGHVRGHRIERFGQQAQDAVGGGHDDDIPRRLIEIDDALIISEAAGLGS